MDDMMDKLQGMLSDEESLKQIKELADMIMSSGGEEKSSGEENGNMGNSSSFSEESSDNTNSGFDFDIGMIMKLAALFNSLPKNDNNTQLLLALKPLLKDEKQERVDKAIKMLKLFSVWNVIKESGMLNDMF